ncbi:unnamed protein product, partial [Onchocerca ochengi]
PNAVNENNNATATQITLDEIARGWQYHSNDEKIRPARETERSDAELSPRSIVTSKRTSICPKTACVSEIVRLNSLF